MMRVRRLRVVDKQDLQPVLELTKREFAYMDALVDHPSSMQRLTIDDMTSGQGEVWVTADVELEANLRTCAAPGLVETERSAHVGSSPPTTITCRRRVPRTESRSQR